MRVKTLTYDGNTLTYFRNEGNTLKTKHDSSTKPYHRCLSCMRFGISCGGHSTRNMSLQDWCEYMRDVKEAKHLTNSYVANVSEVSLKTIERIMAVNYDQDIMRGTARRIEIAVIGTSNQYPCYLDYDDSTTTERINRLLAEIEYWRKENDRKAKIIDKYLE